jgi:hypothetical protein
VGDDGHQGDEDGAPLTRPLPADQEPHYDSSMASEPGQCQPVSERQGDEQPPGEHSLDESWKRRVVRKAVDVAGLIAEAVAENLIP